MSEEVLATINPAPARRTFGTGVMGLLGLVLFYICAVKPPAELHLIALLILLGIGALWTSYAMWTATQYTIEMTEEELRFTDGRLIVRLEDIASVDRSLFSFKPSNGFLVRLKARKGWAWAPGVWWRFGKRIGVGGVVPAAQAKMMADLLAFRLAERDGMQRP